MQGRAVTRSEIKVAKQAGWPSRKAAIVHHVPVPQTGHALKVFNASENLVYGCWDDGLYRYPGYYSGNGAPSDWAGIMLVSPIFVNGEINGFLKVAWDMSMTQYIMKNNKDGSVSQAWTKM